MNLYKGIKQSGPFYCFVICCHLWQVWRFSCLCFSFVLSRQHRYSISKTRPLDRHQELELLQEGKGVSAVSTRPLDRHQELELLQEGKGVSAVSALSCLANIDIR
jgi:hypothetical protein